MADYTYAIDRYLYPITIGASNKTIGWYEAASGGTLLTASIAEGTYYAYGGASVGASYQRLYTSIAAAMTAESTASGAGYTYAISAGTPSESLEQTLRGVRITATDGGSPVAWRLRNLSSSAGSPGVYAAMGFDGGGGDIIANGAGEVYSQRTKLGEWVTPTGVTATDRRSDFERLIAESTRYAERDDHYVVDRGERQVRTVEYEYLPAAHVFSERADDAAHASTGQVGTGDDYNCLEDLWRALATGEKVLAVYHEPGEACDVEVSGYAYEVVKAEGERVKQSFGRMVRPRRMGGEFYDATLPFAVVSSSGFDY